MAHLMEWLANTSPPWAAYQALMTRRLVALDKELGTRLVGIGSVWLQCLAKLMLGEAKQAGKEACGALQLCVGLEAGIEEGLRSVFSQRRKSREGSGIIEGEQDEGAPAENQGESADEDVAEEGEAGNIRDIRNHGN